MARKSGLIALLIGCAATACFAGDYSYFFTISNDVSFAQPNTIVTLWAAFNPQLYAFAHSRTEVWSAPDPGWFSDPKVLLHQYYYSDPGHISPDGDSITGMSIVQLNGFGEFPDAENPIALWSVAWSTDDFTPRNVPIVTRSWDFWVYLELGGGANNFYGPDFSEAQDFIQVVPDPSAAALIAVAGLWSYRRRR